jgi:hypothetical protein
MNPIAYFPLETDIDDELVLNTRRVDHGDGEKHNRIDHQWSELLGVEDKGKESCETQLGSTNE